MSSFLSIQPGEGRSASLMLAHSFAMGLSTSFFETAASALFLARFGCEPLPWVYIAAAVLNTATGLVYSAILGRVRFTRLMGGTLALLFAAVCAFRIGLGAAESGILVFGLMVFYRILSALTDLEFWAVATRLYDVRQAKRLFGMIGSGEVIARIVGSFSVALLVKRLGMAVANLMWISAAGLLACFLIVLVVLRTRSESARRDESKKKAEGGIGRMLRLAASPYLSLLLSITFFAILAKYFVDYAFLEQMKAHNTGAKELAAFFGLFSGVTQVLSLLARVFLSGPILGRFGIRIGLLVLPMAHALCTILLALQGSLVGASASGVFWLVMLNQGIYKTLKHPIDNPSFKVLYQPLRAEERLAAQVSVETIVAPLTTGLAGGVMLLFTKVIPYEPVRFAYVLLVTFVGWLLVAMRAGRAYPVALSEALKGRIVDEEFEFEDERSMAVLRETLGSERPADVLFALDLLERIEHPQLAPILISLVGHASPGVRAPVLDRIERLRPPGALEVVRHNVDVEDVVSVRAAALRCLCTLGGEAVTGEVAKYLEHPEPQIQRAALIGLLRQEHELGESFASRQLASMAASRKPEKRGWAAQVVAEVGRSGFARVLASLLADPAPAVRRAALMAAGKVKEPALWPQVVANLGERAYAGPASRALAAGGEATLPFLEAAWTDAAPPGILLRIARLLGRLGGAEATALLRKRMRHPEERVRFAVFEALAVCGFKVDAGDDAATVMGQVRAEAADATWNLAVLQDLAEEGTLVLLRSALEHEVATSRQRLFLLLSFLYDPTAILRARDHLADASKEKRAYALEILDVTLPRELRGPLLPLFDELSLNERCSRLEEHFPQKHGGLDERIAQVIARSAEWATPWTRGCAAYSVGILRNKKLAEGLEPLAGPGGDPLVRETAAWALHRLGRGGEGRKGMLAIEKVITLKAVEMFANASEDVLADIASILEEVEFQSGQLIFEKGAVGDSLYIIVEGRVRVFDGDRTITQLGERDIFGELALLDPEPRAASIAAVEPTRLLRLDREAFSELMAGNIEIVRGVLSVLCGRLRKQSA